MLFVIDTSANTAGASIFDAIFEFSYLSFKWSISAYLIFTLFQTGSNPVSTVSVLFHFFYFKRENFFACIMSIISKPKYFKDWAAKSFILFSFPVCGYVLN